MIEIATCSYGEFKQELGVPVRASVGFPKWFPDQVGMFAWENVFPKFYWKQLPFDEFRRRYLAMLDGHGAEKLQGDITWMAEQYAKTHDGDLPERLVLLCFEKLSKGPDNWCHRTMLADYLERNLSLNVVELGSLPGPTIDPEPTLF